MKSERKCSKYATYRSFYSISMETELLDKEALEVNGDFTVGDRRINTIK